MKKYLGLLATIILISCSNSDSNKAGDTPAGYIPENISNQELVHKPQLTLAQESEISGIMRKSENLPAMRLFLVEPGESYEEKVEREKDIQDLTPDSRAIYNRIVSQCEIHHPEKQQSGTVSKPGDQVQSTKTASISGSACPISHTDLQQTTVTLTSASQGQMTLVASGSMKTETRILDPTLQNETGTVSTQSEGTFTGSALFANNSMKSYMNTKGRALALTRSGYMVTADLLAESLQTEKGEQGYLRFDFKFPLAEPTIQIFKDQSGNRYFVNGNQLTEAQMEQLFGKSFSETRKSLGSSSLKAFQRRL